MRNYKRKTDRGTSHRETMMEAVKLVPLSWTENEMAGQTGPNASGKNTSCLGAIVFCKSNNITLLSFPPLCSHELQPLDKSVYGPFKTYYQAGDNWMRNPLNAGETMTIHTSPKLISYAFEKKCCF
ncbi:hypothetical protein RRG08_022809 [Elysia crispata]|uniref:DDE-1 domain-containing protein n=1 Tax=Elysia crispata TaxID=231223 RepID=A0AAE0Z0D9_9GAST|nr:hypothetical protein RRG08_022809 [Elysia crispata]